MLRIKLGSIAFFLFCGSSIVKSLPVFAQTPNNIPRSPLPNRPRTPIPETVPKIQPLIPDIESSPPSVPLLPKDIPGSIFIKRFEIINNNVLTSEEIEEVIKPYQLRQVSFVELLEVPEKLTQLYIDKGYITTGAIILPQTVADRVIKIHIIEGELSDIVISGLKRLNSNYIRKRLTIATQTPLNQNKLLNALQLLQINPLTEKISAELSPGIKPNTSLLTIKITEADTFNIGLNLDNNRVASVGSFRRQVELTENNLLGIGDRFNLSYSNSNGSDSIDDISYELPINSYNGKIRLSHSRSDSDIIQEPFDILNIDNKARFYQFSYIQPIYQSLYQDTSLGFLLSHETTETNFDPGNLFTKDNFIGRNAINSDGITKITTLRFFQTFNSRNEKQALGLLSQFNIGIDALDSTIDRNLPDSKFFAWKGQAQYLRLLSPKTSLLLRSNLQLATDGLVSLEQFPVGGNFSVRGYRQNAILGDNGVFISAELSNIIIGNSESEFTLELIPFIDFGKVWNTFGKLEDSINTLSSLGLSLKLSVGDRLNARIDWGIPLTEIISAGESLQENGVHFILETDLF